MAGHLSVVIVRTKDRGLLQEIIQAPQSKGIERKPKATLRTKDNRETQTNPDDNPGDNMEGIKTQWHPKVSFMIYILNYALKHKELSRSFLLLCYNYL